MYIMYVYFVYFFLEKKKAPFLVLSFVVFLESLSGSYGDTMSLAHRTFIEKCLHLLANFLWWKFDRLDLFPAVTAEVGDISTFGTKGALTFFPK